MGISSTVCVCFSKWSGLLGRTFGTRTWALTAMKIVHVARNCQEVKLEEIVPFLKGHPCLYHGGAIKSDWWRMALISAKQRTKLQGQCSSPPTTSSMHSFTVGLQWMIGVTSRRTPRRSKMESNGQISIARWWSLRSSIWTNAEVSFLTWFSSRKLQIKVKTR